jgi:DNA topoisomerase-1
MTPARFEQVGVDVEAGRYTLHAGAAKRVFDGYQAVYVEGRDDEEDERLTILPALEQGEQLRLVELAAQQHFTQPPPRYTEATLIRALEERGIGRPSTYAPTVETIRERGYVEIADRRLTPTEAAFRVNDLLVEYFPEVVDYDFTARMEEQLDDVARGQLRWVPMVRGFYEPFAVKVSEGKEKIPKQVELTDIICPESGHPMLKRFGRSGWFLGCSGYPECRVTMPLPGTEEPALDLPGVGQVCPECGEGHLVARRGRFGPFVGCDRYPDCRFILKDRSAGGQQPSFGVCPQCGKGTVVAKRTRKRRTFWGCDRYPECDYATWTRPQGEAASAGPSAGEDAAPATPAASASGD